MLSQAQFARLLAEVRFNELPGVLGAAQTFSRQKISGWEADRHKPSRLVALALAAIHRRYIAGKRRDEVRRLIGEFLVERDVE